MNHSFTDLNPHIYREENKQKRIRCYRFFEEVLLPFVERYIKQPLSGFHGFYTHTRQVGLCAIDYAMETEDDLLPIMLAAVFHDSAREDDGYNETHGPDAIPIIQTFFNEQGVKLYQRYTTIMQIKEPYRLTETVKSQIISAVQNHTIGTKSPDAISACLWDADRTRISWEGTYQAHFFNTMRGKQVASLSTFEQNAYLQEQRDFLLSHHITSSPTN